MVHVAEGLLDTELNDYIKQVMNTDGIKLDTFMQGISGQANTVFGQKLLVQSAKTSIKCQVCGSNDHTYNTCPEVQEQQKEEIKEYRDRPRPHDGVKHECTYCGMRGHTESNCSEKYPKKMKFPRCGGRHRKSNCFRRVLAKEGMSEHELEDAQLEKIADILQEKLTARSRQAEASSSCVFVAGRGQVTLCWLHLESGRVRDGRERRTHRRSYADCKTKRFFFTSERLQCYPIYKNLFSGVKGLEGPQVHALFPNQRSWGPGPRPPHFPNQGSLQDHKIFHTPGFQTTKLNKKKTACVFSLIGVEMTPKLNCHIGQAPTSLYDICNLSPAAQPELCCTSSCCTIVPQRQYGSAALVSFLFCWVVVLFGDRDHPGPAGVSVLLTPPGPHTHSRLRVKVCGPRTTGPETRGLRVLKSRANSRDLGF